MSDDLTQDAERTKALETDEADQPGAAEPKDSDPTGKPKLKSNKLELNKPADADDATQDAAETTGKKATKKASFPRTRST